jgi:hypothetical protein
MIAHFCASESVQRLSLARVYAALTYYHLHTDEIEADIRDDSEDTPIKKYGRS